MANSNGPSDRNQYPDRNQPLNRNVPQDPNYQDSNDRRSIDESTVHTRPASRSEVAYREGYIQGRNQEEFHGRINRKRENDSAATGVVIGVILASLAGLVVATLYFSPRSQQVEQVPVPVPQNSPSPAPSTERTTIIERQPQIVPVPQQTQIIVPSPDQSNTTQPDTTQSDTTQPSTIQPDSSTTQPEVTQPDSTFTQPDSLETAPSQTSPTDPTGSAQ